MPENIPTDLYENSLVERCDYMDLQELRAKVDKIDDELIVLFEQRMVLSAEVARYKKQHNIPIHDPVREREILDHLSRKVKEGHESSVIALYTLLFELSRNEQEIILEANTEVL